MCFCPEGTPSTIASCRAVTNTSLGEPHWLMPFAARSRTGVLTFTRRQRPVLGLVVERGIGGHHAESLTAPAAGYLLTANLPRHFRATPIPTFCKALTLSGRFVQSRVNDQHAIVGHVDTAVCRVRIHRTAPDRR